MSLQDAIRYFTEETHIMPCLSISCGRKDMALHERGGVINRQGTPLAEDSLFDLASLTKLFTGLLVMRLREEGRLDLARPVAAYAPQFVQLDAVTVDQVLGFEVALTTPERVDTAYFKTFNQTRPMDRPVGLEVGSVLGRIRDMTSVVGMSYLMYDEDEDLFADIVDTFADMQYKCAEAILETGARFDFAHYWEDICFKNGPLLSPEIFNELCAKHYKKRNDLCRKYGIDIISLDCDGVVEELLPTWFENGVNTMFPIEVGVWGDQFAAARKKFGPGLLGVGGMDKTVLRKDKAAVDAEIERIKGLVDLGGFLPCPDHRLMPGTKFELVQYYAEEIKKIRI